jgi:hypothetical protein
VFSSSPVPIVGHKCFEVGFLFLWAGDVVQMQLLR